MNVFELSSFLSLGAGVWGGVAAHHGTVLHGLVAKVAGGGVGLAALVMCIAPGVVMLRLAPGEGLSESRMANVGAALEFVGAFISPMAAFFLARATVRVGVVLLS